MRYAVTFAFTFKERNAPIVASTAAAPLMSIFIDAWLGSLGFNEMPPESYMTPLPTNTMFPDAFVGRYSNFTIRGGSTLPAFTPTRPPQPIAMSWSRLYTVAFKPLVRATSTARSAN